MKKILLVLMILIVGVIPKFVDAKMIQGGVVYTVESARDEAFKNMEYSISMKPYEQYLKDPGYSPPKKAGAKSKIQRWGRSIQFFSDGGYGVRNYEDYDKILYYSKNGVLENIEIRTEKQFPYISKKYDSSGKLKTVFYNVAPNDTYIYDETAKYIGRWIGKNHYDENNNLDGQRY